MFERMVRSTKRCLRKMIGHAKLTYDELVTVLAEVEAVVNSRPIAYVSTADLDEALTPSHLLIGRRVLDLPDHLYPEPEDFELKPDILSRRNRYLNRLLSRFWEKWMKEYLLELRNAHRYHKGTSQENQVSVGDIVVVHDDLPRGFWKLGCVEKLLSGRDGTVRGATVRVTTNGKCTLSIDHFNVYTRWKSSQPQQKVQLKILYRRHQKLQNSRLPTLNPAEVHVHSARLRKELISTDEH